LFVLNKSKNYKIVKFDENSCCTMWHYVALSKKQKIIKSLIWMKTAVALCGTIKKAKNTKNSKFNENSCGTMWHYVALSKTFVFCNF
jgi:hypothetical protein